MKKLIIGVTVLLAIVFAYGLGHAEIKDVDLATISTDRTDIQSKPITRIGLDWSYGKSEWLFDDLQSPSCENTVNRFTFRAETNSLFPSLDKLFIGGEFRYSIHKADEKPEGSYNMGHDAGFREYGFNVTAKWEFGWFYAGAFAGLSYWYDRDHGMHNLGDSHCLGTWGPLAGLNIPITGPWELRLEGRGAHTSDPFQSDRGKNWLEGTIGVSYVF